MKIQICLVFVTSLFACVSLSKGFLDCTKVPAEDSDYPELDEWLCQDAATRCGSQAQIPIVFDFREFGHRDYVRQLPIPLADYKDAADAVIPVYVYGNKRYYTPDMAVENDPSQWQNIQGGAARIMDSGRPEGNDYDLGTPNEKFPGGIGIGLGGEPGMPGENPYYLGNILLIQERNKLRVDDSRDGGRILFDFVSLQQNHASNLVITDVGLLDIESPAEDGSQVSTLLTDQAEYAITDVMGAGDNSFINVPILSSQGVDPAIRFLELELQGSGAIAYLKGCINNKAIDGPICVNTNPGNDLDQDCTPTAPLCVDELGNDVPLQSPGDQCITCRNDSPNNGLDSGCTDEFPLCADDSGTPVEQELAIGTQCVDEPEDPFLRVNATEYYIAYSFFASSVPDEPPSADQRDALVAITRDFWFEHFQAYYQDRGIIGFKDLVLTVQEEIFGTDSPAGERYDYYIRFDTTVVYELDFSGPLPSPVEVFFDIMGRANLNDYIQSYVWTLPEPFFSVQSFALRVIQTSS